MRLFLGDRLLNMSLEELDSLYLDEGSEGIIYRVGDDVLKLYKDSPLVTRLSVSEIDRLRKIKTQRFIMPKDVILTDDDNVVGYSSTFVEKSPFSEIFSLKGKDFKREIKTLMEDIKEISSNGIEIDDLHLSNIVLSHGRIFFIDPGSFIVGNMDERESYQINKFRFSNFIVNDLMAVSIPKKYRRKLDRLFSSCEDIEKFLESMGEEETVENFSNRIVK
jgi:tRNA A-37 threonylcarbamoyl transferase component Bud32